MSPANADQRVQQEATKPGECRGRRPALLATKHDRVAIGVNGSASRVQHASFGDYGVVAEVTDGVIRRMIDKWLKAGVLEHDLLQHTTEGTPQGGVVSPVLANIYLHHVLDEWFELDVRPRLKGNNILVRYADDSVMAFEVLEDAKRVIDVLGKRLQRHGLKLHPDKTRLVDFRIYRPDGVCHPDTGGTTFDFLGFTHLWSSRRKG